MQTFYIIGISDNRNQFLSPEIRNLVSQGKVFSGGKRHHELVHAYLPEDAVWIDITVPLDAVFCRYEEHPEIIVFASGDPLFFGFANTVMRKLPSAKIILFPTFNSLQMLAHRRKNHSIHSCAIPAPHFSYLYNFRVRSHKYVLYYQE